MIFKPFEKISINSYPNKNSFLVIYIINHIDNNSIKSKYYIIWSLCTINVYYYDDYYENPIPYPKHGLIYIVSEWSFSNILP